MDGGSGRLYSWDMSEHIKARILGDKPFPAVGPIRHMREDEERPMSGFFKRFASAALLAGSALVLGLVPAAAEQATVLGVFQKWSAFSSGTGDAKVCYALSQPASTEPKRAKRDPIYFLINDWPSRKAKAEPEIVPGYLYKDGSAVSVQVGADKFVFFTKNDGAAGNAWVQAEADEERLIAAMKANSLAVVTGQSKRGTLTRDTYAMAGLSEALDKVHQACGL